MRSLSPARAVARRARQFLVTGLIVALVGLVLLALGALLIIIPLSRADWYATLQTTLLVLGLLTGLVGLIVVARGLTLPTENRQALRMAEVLARSLDYRYTFIRNVSLRGLGYLDAVLVGPNGALVLHFFEGRGAFYYEGTVWYRRDGRELRLASANPTQEVIKDVRALRQFLMEDGLGQMPVYGVVVLVHPRTVVSVQQPVVPVAHMGDVVAALRDNYLALERVSIDLVEATIRVIMKG